MLDDAIASLGASRLLWACDLTIETGLAKLRALEVIGLSDDAIADIRWRNAVRLFPESTFTLDRADSASVTSRHTPLATRHS
jgi:hypothetical protein